MEDYTIYKEEKNYFIIGYLKNVNDIYVYFANNDVWKVENTEFNEQKILEQMEKQIETGKTNEKAFKNIKNTHIGLALTTFVVSTGIIIFAKNDVASILATGVALTSMGNNFIKIAKNSSIIQDIEKSKFFIENKNVLNDKITEDRNLTVGLKRKIKKNISYNLKNNELAFDINSINEMSLDDLKKIKSNIEVSDNYSFDVKKVKIKKDILH